MISLLRRCYPILLVALVGVSILAAFTVVSIRSHEAHASVSSFVTRNGTHLEINGSAFRFSGANMEWLGSPGQTAFEVEDAFTTVQEMGGTVARSLWLTSIGTPDSLQPSLRNYNNEAFARSDFAIKKAGDYGIRLIIPLIDNNPNGNGDYTHYTQWRGISDSSQFFTNSTVIGDFEAFISAYLNHVNSYTGVAYKDDPTILAWETGNEIAPPQSWSQTIADYIKSIDGHHLIASGPLPPGINRNDLNVASIDIADEHFYPMSVSSLNDNAAAASNANKVYIAGEYDWGSYYSGSSLTDFLAAIESNSAVSGDLYWELFPHRNTYGFEPYNAGALGLALGLHFPGDTSDMRNRVNQLRSHAFTMAGVSSLPAHIVPGVSVIDQIAGQRIYWRGAAGADTYSIQRSTSGSTGPWTTICNRCITDATAPYTDTTQPSNTQSWYRVRPYSLSGSPGPYSQVVQAQNDTFVGNNSFETPAFTSGTFQTAPGGASWSFNGSAGISTNGSAFTVGNPGAPAGSQVAWLQSAGSFAIGISLQTNTNYCMTFFAAQRGNYNNGGNDFQMLFDGQVSVGTFKPDNEQYALFVTSTINVATPNHTIQFVGLDTAGGDNTVFIDNVRIVLC